jgi:hypothetical protein
VNNPESIREFFRKMADGTMAKSNTDRLAVLHNSQSFLPRTTAAHNSNNNSNNNNNNEYAEANFVQTRDFGIGLPPLANR